MQEANQPQHRQNFISWEKYFMGIAFLARHRSKDPNYQAGACIVRDDKRIAAIGYNGMPTGCSDNTRPWGKRTASPLDSQFFYVCHAEANAIMFRNSADLKGCTMFTTLFPCNECAKMIIQSGITKVVYFSDERRQEDEYVAARTMLEEARVSFEQYTRNREGNDDDTGNCETIELRFSTENLGA